MDYHGHGGYTDHAGLEIFVNSRIASPFSRQIAIGNAGPSIAKRFDPLLSYELHCLP